MEFDPKIHITRDEARRNVREVIITICMFLSPFLLGLLIRWIQF